jgi:hypothetical protein
MMTRGQVAKRLGVSVAAVRKFEGTELHPEMRGRRWIFDPTEVDGLARLRARGGGRLATPFNGEGSKGSDPDDGTRDIDELPEDLDDLLGEVDELPDDIFDVADSPMDLSRRIYERELQTTRRLLGLKNWRPPAETLQQQLEQRACDAERRSRLERQELVLAVGGLLAELDGLRPRQLKRFLRSNEDVDGFLDAVEQLADEDTAS